MNGILTFASLLVCAVIVFAVPTLVVPDARYYSLVTVFYTGKAILLSGAVAAVVGYFAFRQRTNGPFLLKVFFIALLLRVMVGVAIFVFNGQDFFGGDALTYDSYGYAQSMGWAGDRYYQSVADAYVRGGLNPGWGMVYFVAAVYTLIGRNMLAIQCINAVMGAATAPIIFLSAHHIFQNIRVARLAAVAVALYPSLVLWSSQGLKDGPIVFFLALSILATLRIGEKFSVKYVLLLSCSLFALLSLRFYVFYMIAVAIAGALIVGMQKISTKSFFRQFIVIIFLGLSLTYLGVTRYANLQYERFGSLQRVQSSREDASTSAQSGFGKDVDVSTTSGALSTIPIGLLYLLFAPFPWQVTSLRQTITLPEMIIWWASFPMLILGLWFSVRYRLRQISPILIFTIMLSLAYSVFQGNVGTAYRQRAQLLVFYFIFIAVGYVLMLEKREERKRLEMAEKEALAANRYPDPRQAVR